MGRDETLLMVADSERDANMLYAVRMFVPDPFIYLRMNGRPVIVLSDLEIDRARKQAKHCKAVSYASIAQRLLNANGKKPSSAHVIKALLKEKRRSKVFVPGNFPHGLARQLRQLKVKVKVSKGPVFPERELKNAQEVKCVSAAVMMAEVGLAEGIQALKSSKIGKGNTLFLRGAPLTAEKLRSIIDIAVIQAGGIANHTIVSCGKLTCDPHERGYGPLKANQPIILDVFPKSQRTGYYGDISRTVVKGKASEALRKMYDTVVKGQDVAISKLKAGVRGVEVHQAVKEFFDGMGYRTGKLKGRMQGFFHGTGHGLGLEIHEAPRLSVNSEDILQAGHIVTVEPGLYYHDIGGVRIEDDLLVTAHGARNLTKFEKILEV
ncbi:MAG TPA: Xaa-Pro peptidase family protein [Verrucomicrobiae bacterium]